jgi:hypothetical protein
MKAQLVFDALVSLRLLPLVPGIAHVKKCLQIRQKSIWEQAQGVGVTGVRTHKYFSSYESLQTPMGCKLHSEFLISCDG